MRRTFFWHLIKTIKKFLEINLFWLAEEKAKSLKDYLNSAKINYELSSDNRVFSPDLDPQFANTFQNKD